MTCAEGAGEGEAGQENLRECWRCLCVLRQMLEFSLILPITGVLASSLRLSFLLCHMGWQQQLVDVEGAACEGGAWLGVAAGACWPAPVRPSAASFEEGTSDSTLILCRVFRSSFHQDPLCTSYSGSRVHLSPTRW